jgi:hypothetical protein
MNNIIRIYKYISAKLLMRKRLRYNYKRISSLHAEGIFLPYYLTGAVLLVRTFGLSWIYTEQSLLGENNGR